SRADGRGFFLQAEDGIRVFHVTGVQTCALPISGKRTEKLPLPSAASHGPSPHTSAPWSATVPPSTGGRRGMKRHFPRRPEGEPRSEERRVGKEGGPGWSPSEQE